MTTARSLPSLTSQRRHRSHGSHGSHRALQLAALSSLVALVGIVAVGCGGNFDSGSKGENTGEVHQKATVCPKGSMLTGIDVSEWQGSVDWNAVKSSGRTFAFARISDGGYHDKYFGANWPAMKAAGIVRGSYQFFEPAQDPNAQADIVIAAVGHLDAGDLPVVADMEVTGGQSAATILANLHTWVDKVTAGTGKKPMIYTGKYWWEGNVGDSADFVALPLWHAQYTSAACPDIANAWSGWAFWQFTDKDSCPGVGGGVDGDRFNGTAADLGALTGGSAGSSYGAQYVSQTWPLAATALKMTPGQVIDASITMKNIGTKAWDANTKLGTTVARDRSSPFAGSDWLAPNRAASVGGAVAPGADGTFKFKFHAPTTPGDYHEHFGLVEEGVTWFGDQGGPADAVIEAWIQVVPAKFAAQWVSQSFPTSDKTLTMKLGEVVDGYIELKNIGTDPWKAGETKLAPTPRDKNSPLGQTGWLSPTRISSPPTDVAPGASYKFPVKLTGNKVGDYVQTFGMIEEGVTWFSDYGTGGGGPPDDFLKVHVVVTQSATGGDGGPNPGTDGGLPGDGGATPPGINPPGNDLAPSGDKGGCGCSTPGSSNADRTAAWLALGAIGACVMRWRRRKALS